MTELLKAWANKHYSELKHVHNDKMCRAQVAVKDSCYTCSDERGLMISLVQFKSIFNHDALGITSHLFFRIK